MSEAAEANPTAPTPTPTKELTDPLAANWPEVNTAAVDAHIAKTKGEAPPVVNGSTDPRPQAKPDPDPVDLPAKSDALGRPFDSVKFRPEFDSLGRWKNRRGGRKAKHVETETPSGSVIGPDPEPEPPADADAEQVEEVEPLAAAAYARQSDMYLRGGYDAAGRLFGSRKEWQPDDAAEHREMRESLADWLEEMRARKVSPAWRFGLNVLDYVLKRSDRPETAKRIDSFSPFFRKIFRLKPTAQTVTGQDREHPGTSQDRPADSDPPATPSPRRRPDWMPDPLFVVTED